MLINRVLLIILIVGVWANIFTPKEISAHEDQYIYAYQIYDLDSAVEDIVRTVVERCEVDEEEIDC